MQQASTTNHGLLVVLSSPSGGGKTTVIKQLLKNNSLPFVYSTSMTTRPKRANEVDGVDYWFVDENTFRERIDSNDLLEYEQVHDYLYGTPIAPLQAWLNKGKVVLLDLDVKGALAVRKLYPDSSMLIFLKPPDFNVLHQRLSGRSTENHREISKRLLRVPEEMELATFFDHVVVNQELSDTVELLITMINERIAQKI